MNNEETKIHHQTQPMNSITAPVLVPLLQAVITGALSGVFLGICTAAFHAKFSPWAAGAVVWAGVTLFSWLSFRGRWQWVIERAVGVDINDDGYIGEPEAETETEQPESLRVELIQESGRVGDYINLPYADRLPEFAAGVISGRQLTVTTWTGQGQLFSRAEFENLRDVLLKRGLARWRNPNAPGQGVELTKAGTAIFRRLAGTPTPPHQLKRNECAFPPVARMHMQANERILIVSHGSVPGKKKPKRDDSSIINT